MSSQTPACLQICLDSNEDREYFTHFNSHGDLLQLPLYTVPFEYNSLVKYIQRPKKDTSLVRLGSILRKTPKSTALFSRSNLLAKQINNTKEKSTYKFLHLTRTLCKNQIVRANGPLYHFSFSMDSFEKDYESYNGISASTRYYLKATLEKKSGGQMVEEQEFILHVPVTTPVASNPISLQLRIADYLILRVDFGKRDFYADEHVVGKITVEKNAMEIQKVQIHLVKKEIVNISDSSLITHEEVLTRQDIYNGDPQTGDILPFKLHLGSQNVDPCLLDHHPKFLIKYALTLNFVDSEDRSLFKHININILRRK